MPQLDNVMEILKAELGKHVRQTHLTIKLLCKHRDRNNYIAF